GKYEKENAVLEEDIAKLQKIVAIPWKKEEELKQMKIELDGLERKIKRELEELEKKQAVEADVELEEEENLVAI
ncbi:MAG: hypothetical protein LBV71_03620, partial [Prevotella sp.]|nr:hypothetical protein [Prevotella sp.]